MFIECCNLNLKKMNQEVKVQEIYLKKGFEVDF